MSNRACDMILASVLLALIAAFYSETLSEVYARTGIGAQNNAVFYPRILLGSLALLSVSLFTQAWLKGDAKTVEIKRHLPSALAVLALTVIFAFAFMSVPFVIAASLYCAAVGYLLGYRRHLVLALISIGVPVIIWLMFENVLGIQLP